MSFLKEHSSQKYPKDFWLAVIGQTLEVENVTLDDLERILSMCGQVKRDFTNAALDEVDDIRVELALLKSYAERGIFEKQYPTEAVATDIEDLKSLGSEVRGGLKQ